MRIYVNCCVINDKVEDGKMPVKWCCSLAALTLTENGRARSFLPVVLALLQAKLHKWILKDLIRNCDNSRIIIEVVVEIYLMCPSRYKHTELQFQHLTPSTNVICINLSRDKVDLFLHLLSPPSFQYFPRYEYKQIIFFLNKCTNLFQAAVRSVLFGLESLVVFYFCSLSHLSLNISWVLIFHLSQNQAPTIQLPLFANFFSNTKQPKLLLLASSTHTTRTKTACNFGYFCNFCLCSVFFSPSNYVVFRCNPISPP